MVGHPWPLLQCSIKVIKLRLTEFDLVRKRINGRSFWKGIKLKI